MVLNYKMITLHASDVADAQLLFTPVIRVDCLLPYKGKGPVSYESE